MNNYRAKEEFPKPVEKNTRWGFKSKPISIKGMHFSKDLVGKSGDKKPDDIQ